MPESDGLVDAVQMKTAAINMGLKKANPTIYAVCKQLTDLDAKGKTHKMVDFDQFFEAILNHLGDTTSDIGRRNIFDQLKEPSEQNINIHSLRGVARELQEDMSHEDIHMMLQRAASNGEEITYEDFVAILRQNSK